MLSGIFQSILNVIFISWWVFLPAGLFFIWNEYWVRGKTLLWRKSIKWTFLDIKIPKDVLKTPKAMEHIFNALHSLGSKPGFEDIYFKGEEAKWFTCELVGYAGGIHFHVCFPSNFKNLFESAIYSEYPDTEIKEVEDYTTVMPEVLPNEIFDIFGQDFILDKANPYPIKTYSFFESTTEEQRLDSISTITEVMSRLQKNEAIWLQYLLKPVGDDWKKEGEEIRDRMMQRDKKKKSYVATLIDGLFHFFKNLFNAPVVYPTWPEGEKKEDKSKTPHLSPGEREVLEAVENKISKLGFEGAIRFLYIDRKDAFTPSNVSAINGALKQFNTQHLNGLKSINETKTSVTSSKLTHKSWFRERKIYNKKRAIYDLYRLRWLPPKLSVFNSEELAALFHFPIVSVESPLLRRSESRRGEPPAGLPIE